MSRSPFPFVILGSRFSVHRFESPTGQQGTGNREWEMVPNPKGGPSSWKKRLFSCNFRAQVPGLILGIWFDAPWGPAYTSSHDWDELGSQNGLDNSRLVLSR